MSETRDFDTICVEKESKDNFNFSIAKFKKGFEKKTLKNQDPSCADSVTSDNSVRAGWPQRACPHPDEASCCTWVVDENNWAFAFSQKAFGPGYVEINKTLQLKSYVFIRLLKMSARPWHLVKTGGCCVRPACSALLPKRSSHDMPENLHYYNKANKNGKLWILYRCIKKCNFSVTWITPNRCSGPLKEGSSTLLLCAPLNILLSDYFKDGNNRREFNSGLYFEGQVRFPPAPHPCSSPPFRSIEHSYLVQLLKWGVILLMNKIKR